MSINNSQRAQCGTELAATMTGSTVLIGTLPQNPVQIIFDNQSTVAIAIYHNQQTNIWRTFPAGEALVLDMRGNKGLAPNFTFNVGDSFYGNGVSGVFSISYTFAKNV